MPEVSALLAFAIHVGSLTFALAYYTWLNGNMPGEYNIRLVLGWQAVVNRASIKKYTNGFMHPADLNHALRWCKQTGNNGKPHEGALERKG